MNKVIQIGYKKIGVGLPPYIIAEMACAHDGDFNKAQRIIDAAVEAKADAIQLQFFVSDETVTPAHPVYQVLKRIEFSSAQWTDLFNYARSKGIHVFVCTYDLPSVILARSLKADGIKLNSADLSNPEVIAAVAQSGIPFTLGTGASTLAEIKTGLEYAGKNGAQNMILMHGVQNFPTKTEDLNILRLKLLQENFDVPVGYHDHTEGDDSFANIVDLIAVGMGAAVIEKHITLDRKEKGIDYQAALEPVEFKRFVENIHRGYISLGKKEQSDFTESDLRYRKFQKKSIVAAREIKIGESVTRGMIKFLRNKEPGLAPSQIELVLNKKASSLIPAFTNITSEILEP